MLRLADSVHRALFLLFVLMWLIPAKLHAETQPKQSILVAAAASLRDVLEEIGPLFEKQFPGIQVTFQFAASGALQQQIEQGAPVDVFISAAPKQVDALLEKNLLVQDSLRNLVSNELVVVVPKRHAPLQSLDELKKPEYKRIALGESRSVPAGQYAKDWLAKAGLLETLTPRLIPAANVRQVLTFVETGNVSAGFVYASDALTSSQVKIGLRANPNMHPPIIYPLALIKRSSHQKAGQAFSTFLQSIPARPIWQKHGFTLIAEKAS